ncbi:hypothetical protein LCGC14_1592210 [marine sediment metagenome]|uniref:Uncharacterized protein n=1 Tax=marine sediment metagenome TaxID=412755 RepID=A0A0F9IDJ9_9ZZZZ
MGDEETVSCEVCDAEGAKSYRGLGGRDEVLCQHCWFKRQCIWMTSERMEETPLSQAENRIAFIVGTVIFYTLCVSALVALVVWLWMWVFR